MAGDCTVLGATKANDYSEQVEDVYVEVARAHACKGRRKEKGRKGKKKQELEASIFLMKTSGSSSLDGAQHRHLYCTVLGPCTATVRPSPVVLATLFVTTLKAQR